MLRPGYQNKTTMKKKKTPNKVGRPKKYATPEEMQKVIDGYFDECKEQGTPLTVEGMAMALDMDRNTILTYGKSDTHAEFHCTIKKAKAIIQADFIERALKGEYNPTICIFLMKNNFGYEDKYQHDVKQEKLITGMSKSQIAEALADE